MHLFNKKTLLASVISLLCAALPAGAQFHLPATHATQHESLIANQRPAGVDINTIKINAYANEATEDITDFEDDIFNYNWESQSVSGAYQGMTIPQTANIDVTGYVHPIKGRVTSNYGYRPRFGRMHKGIDLGLSVGDTIVAAFDGKVRIAKFERRGYGYYLVVRHDNGLETVYGHLSRFLVKPDQYVRAGQPIALGGNTGRSTGPHLHFETRFMGLAINPAAIIDFENYVPHKDVFSFDKSSYDKSQKYGPSSKKKHKASKRKKRSKSTASRRRKR